MLRKIVSGITLTLLLISLSTLMFSIQPVDAETKTIYVDDDNTAGPWDGTQEHPYQNITSGLEHASTNDTVYVYSGLYYEHLTVNKSLYLIGEDRDNTIIDGVGVGHVLYVTSPNTNITGFTIQNGVAGIYLYDSHGNYIFENYFLINTVGIYFHHTNFSQAFRNDFQYNYAGIRLNESEFNWILRSNFSNNHAGIEIRNSRPVPAQNTVVLLNNFINNTIQVSTDQTYFFSGGIPFGISYCGNYWNDYTGIDLYCGPYQNETGSDGIIDSPYTINANNTDRYPRMKPCRDPGWKHEWLSWMDTLRMEHEGLEDRFILTGEVENPLNLTYKELLWFPMWSENETLICYNPPKWEGPFPVVTCEWTGVPLSHLLNLAELNPNAKEVIFHGHDHFYSSLDIETALDPHVLLALKGNGTFLSEVYGYGKGRRIIGGFRLVVPGKYGYKWVNDIVRIQVVDTEVKESMEYMADYPLPENDDIPDSTPPELREYHDVSVVDVQTSKTVVGQGCPLSLNVTVENHVNVTETFNVTAYASAITIETIETTLRGPFNYTTITFTWNTTGISLGNYTLSAYASPVPNETYITDNKFIGGWVVVSILGDINADGIVNILDIATVAKAYGSYPGHPNWNPNADLDDNDIINILDIATVAKEYGKTY